MKNFEPHKDDKEPKTKVLLSVPNEKLATIDSLANKYELTRSSFIMQCIDYAVENMNRK